MKVFDYSKLQNILWDKDILNYIGLIHEYKGRQGLYFSQQNENLDVLVQTAKRQSTEASNEIEGIITTNQRLKALVEEKTEPKNRNEKEILGYNNVINLIHDSYEYIPIAPSYILQLHKELYSYMDVNFGGKFKDTPNEIDIVYPNGTKKTIFKPLEPYETPEAIEKLCKEYNKAIPIYNLDPLIVIPVFIHDFLCIHPFNDGNGRVSRLLTILLLHKTGYLIGKYISIEKKIQLTKSEYYDALSESSLGWSFNNNDETPFIKYMLGVIISAYRDFEDRVNMVRKKLPAKEMIIKAINQKLGNFTKSEIQELCPEISIKSIEKVLKELCDDKVIKKEGTGRATFYIRNN